MAPSHARGGPTGVHTKRAGPWTPSPASARALKGLSNWVQSPGSPLHRSPRLNPPTPFPAPARLFPPPPSAGAPNVQCPASLLHCNTALLSPNPFPPPPPSRLCSPQGVQFHPESIITEDGKRIVANFVKTLDA